MSDNNIFLNSKRICSDTCAKETKDRQNDLMMNYSLYQHLQADCDGRHARFPAFSYDHVNLTGRAGYGIAEGCVVDNYSALRNDPAQLTRDRCRMQLFSRIFQGCPNLKPGVPDPDKEMPLLQGTGSTDYEGVAYPCKKTLTELETYHFVPLVDCVKQVQSPTHVVEPWVRGGDPTRDFVRRKAFLEQCSKEMMARGNTRAQAVSLH